MKDNAEKIQAVINTIKMLDMPMTYENADHVLGIYQTLVEVRDSIINGGKDDGGENKTD